MYILSCVYTWRVKGKRKKYRTVSFGKKRLCESKQRLYASELNKIKTFQNWNDRTTGTTDLPKRKKQKNYQLDSVQLKHRFKTNSPLQEPFGLQYTLSPTGGYQKPVCLPQNRPGRAQGR